MKFQLHTGMLPSLNKTKDADSTSTMEQRKSSKSPSRGQMLANPKIHPLYHEIKTAEEQTWDLAAEEGGRHNLTSNSLTDDCVMTFFDGETFGPNTTPTLTEALHSKQGAIKKWSSYYFYDVKVRNLSAASEKDKRERPMKITYRVEAFRKSSSAKDAKMEKLDAMCESEWVYHQEEWRMRNHRQTSL